MANPKILENLRKARTELNQKELAEILGMSSSTYRRMIDEGSPFTMEIIQKASKYFKVSEDVILGRVPLFTEAVDTQLHADVTRHQSLMVVLDGTKVTLERWIARLTAINRML